MLLNVPEAVLAACHWKASPVYPERVNKGWTVELLLKLRFVDEYNPPIGQTTLNNFYPNNKDIFFYLGTRAENKFYHLHDLSFLLVSFHQLNHYRGVR